MKNIYFQTLLFALIAVLPSCIEPHRVFVPGKADTADITDATDVAVQPHLDAGRETVEPPRDVTIDPDVAVSDGDTLAETTPSLLTLHPVSAVELKYFRGRPLSASFTARLDGYRPGTCATHQFRLGAALLEQRSLEEPEIGLGAA